MRTKLILATAAFSFVAMPAFAQTSPTPGPTRPETGASPLSKPGTDMVINPTDDECRAGWNDRLKWTRDQFEGYCAKLKSAK